MTIPSLKDQFESLAGPQYNALEEIRKIESSYATLCLNTLYLLNGGGVLSLPPIAALLRESNQDVPFWTVLVAAIFFIAGLTFAMTANQRGYASMRAFRECLQIQIGNLEAQFYNKDDDNRITFVKSDEASERRNTGEKLANQASVFFWWAFGSFILGAATIPIYWVFGAGEPAFGRCWPLVQLQLA